METQDEAGEITLSRDVLDRRLVCTANYTVATAVRKWCSRNLLSADTF